MKLEVMLDESIEKEMSFLIDKRLDSITKLSPNKKKYLVQSILQKAINENPKLISSTLKEMGNGEFFGHVKNC